MSKHLKALKDTAKIIGVVLIVCAIILVPFAVGAVADAVFGTWGLVAWVAMCFLALIYGIVYDNPEFD